MKNCPTCNIEYDDVATQCSDCGTLLIESMSKQEVTLDTCDNCGKEAPVDRDFCPHCGTLFADNQYSCTNHPIAVATGVCIICEQLFCDDCLTQKNKKNLCIGHREVEVREDWALAYKSVDFYEAQIIRAKLESAGITVNPTNNSNPGFMADGMIESTIGRTLLRYPIKIFVPLDEYLEACEVLDENSQIHDDDNSY
jgi:hypothetical protein